MYDVADKIRCYIYGDGSRRQMMQRLIEGLSYKKLLKNKKLTSAMREGISSIGQFATPYNIYSDMRKIFGMIFGRNENSNLYIKEPYSKV